MDTKSKFTNFVAKLEQKMLDSNQESMVLLGIQGEEIGGSNGSCTNGVAACSGSINNRKCTNSNDTGCTGSINSRTCNIQ
ncbi:MAG TPA: hypothetical protein DEQ87_06995 [Algoriphagus sp.]|jgi:hypothetical protein|uniref:hypothetical protein n=1 Tax=unclassified Algoriphagus TaxID=2641541 RepID=UPI000C561CCD|nr:MULTISPECIES: hypothetical protein [unclassified Algoriphagus]MAL12977.1 hypothetical protein [Algoriphagus sp.]MAN85751.1 hypothetical protein [Algoriphagus sp.]QYH39336.1 hypothetical protein GYM62_11285 [Algoriphagus sp. NBT04N3]HAH38466.1 hypothetical protein [Algoriphagus sp.]HAS60547.1 hypothetical protein [Algoriphagus sp.]|tara:strand:- start:81 stop:320 length:240 start_codon:yes stop_codon:yes gene_type:complete